MRIVLLGGAPGVGKSTTARELLRHAAAGPVLVQWVEVDALWSHQPWRVDEVTVAMLHGNLRAVLANAAVAAVEVLLVTWVFQDSAMHDLIGGLAPEGSEISTVQLRLGEEAWRERFVADVTRPGIDQFFEQRYCQAQSTVADHLIDVDGLAPHEIATAVSSAIGLRPPRHPR